VYKVCKADMPILDNNVCNRDTKHTGKVTENMVCAGYLTPEKVEKCTGDAGGPLIVPNSGRSTLVINNN
jgi:secreted trypsin-like serine protease